MAQHARAPRHRRTLTFVAPDGESHQVVGARTRPRGALQINDWDVLRRIMARGDIGLGEEYIAGSWDTDDVEALISLFLLNLDQLENFSDGNFINRLGFVIHNALVRRNSVAGSSRNIKAHYDVGNDFYRLWLDQSMTYSSALYAGTDELYRAQQNKYERILSKFEKPRASVLEIGCGWGGFAERAGADAHQVTGLTISPAQHEFACQRLNGAADIRLEDYRKCKGKFDNIVSIEMFEAVGEHYWPQYFPHRRRTAEARRPRRHPDHHHPRRTVRRLSHPQRFHPPLCLPRRHAAVAGALPRGSGKGRPEIRRRLRLRQGLCPHLARMVGGCRDAADEVRGAGP